MDGTRYFCLRSVVERNRQPWMEKQDLIGLIRKAKQTQNGKTSTTAWEWPVFHSFKFQREHIVAIYNI